MKRLILMVVVLLIAGCGKSVQAIKNDLPSVITSRDQQWTIPKGIAFKAIQKPAYKELTEFIAEADLAVLYKGNLLDLEKEANRKAIKMARGARMNGALIGIIGSLVSIIGGAFAKNYFENKWGKKGA